MMKNLAVLGLAATILLPGQITPVTAAEIEIGLWTRADRSGPLRAGNIVAAADTVNKMLAAAGSPDTVTVSIHENNAKGFDADALDLMKAFAANKAPDIYVAAHEWIGAFAEAGYAMNLEDHIAANPEYYADVIPVLWNATLYLGKRHAIPQDSEIRMFFYNKDMLRQIGKSEDFIEGLPAMVESGEFTIWDLSSLAKEVVDGGAAEYGIVHRPNVGPDFLMTMASFGFDPMDEQTGKLQASRSALEGFLSWIKWNADNGVTPSNNTSFSWDTINHLLPEGKTFIKHHGLWDVPRQIRFGVSEDSEEAYTNTVGWVHSPAAEKGGSPANLSHPIVYAVNPGSEHADLAALLVAIASQPYFNTPHAVTTGHTAIMHAQSGMPAYQEAWALSRGAKLLPNASFMPNHTQIGPFNQAIYKGIQGVETGRISVEEGVDFILDELESELGDDVVILD
ncbi:MAG: extracellular solute-binding protein [Rhodobacteraceae bacterium]|nr:extracellular solute-binding protein [Paracoccaceae bacterium]